MSLGQNFGSPLLTGVVSQADIWVTDINLSLPWALKSHAFVMVAGQLLPTGLMCILNQFKIFCWEITLSWYNVIKVRLFLPYISP